MKYLRRFVWYLASRLLLICCVLGLIVVTFYYAMNAANMSVVLKDGMAQRAKVVMMGEEPDDLNKYFLSTYLDRDEVLLLTQQGNSPYRDYTIRGIDHRLTWSGCGAGPGMIKPGWILWNQSLALTAISSPACGRPHWPRGERQGSRRRAGRAPAIGC